MDKQTEYAAKIHDAIISLLSDEENDNYIGLEEINEGNNATAFLHALANVAPALIYDKLTQKETEQLEFNHIANRLIFQFCNVDHDSKIQL